jgi:hypothetical protein
MVNKSPNKKKSKSSLQKIIVAIAIIIGVLFVLLILAAPAMKVMNVDPEAKFVESVVNTCSEECVQSGDSSNACILACLEEDKVIEQAGSCDACLEVADINQCLLATCIPPK